MDQHSAALISVVVPVKNGEAFLRDCLKSIYNQCYPNFEVIVVDDGSSDSTASIATEFSDAKLVRLDGRGSSVAKNEGVALAVGEFVAFTDADCIVDANWLTELKRGIEEGVVSCGGSQHSPAKQPAFGQDVQRFFELIGFVSEYYKSADEIVDCEHNPTCNAMFRTDALREMGGFLADLWPCEDLELDLRLRKQNKRIRFNPFAKVYHFRPRHFGGLMRMIWRYGVAHGQLVQLHGFYRRLHLLAIGSLAGLLAAGTVTYLAGWSVFLKVFLLAVFFGWLYLFIKTRHLVRSCRFLFWTVSAGIGFTVAFWTSWLKQICKRTLRVNKTSVNHGC